VPVVLTYIGLGGLLAAAAGLVRPLRFVGMRTRRSALKLLVPSGLFLFVGLIWPATLLRAPAVSTELDRAMPAWQFHELHTIRVHASPAIVYRAVKQVTPEEIALFRTLTWIRSPRLGGPSRESILAPRSGAPILETAIRTDFMLLADDPDREIVMGTLLGRMPQAVKPSPREYIELHRAGFAKAAMNFLIEPEGEGWCTLRTETRIFATDRRTRALFGAYWRIIYPGSALLRVTWLRAVKRRAEGTASAATLVSLPLAR
jgi:hypothetical protein